MKLRWLLWASLTLVVMNVLPASADVLLKNGRHRSGRVTKIDDQQVEVTGELPSGQMVSTCTRDQIESIDGLTYDDFRILFERRHAFINNASEETFKKVLKESKKRIKKKTGIAITVKFEPKLITKKDLSKYLAEKLANKESDRNIEQQKKLWGYLGVINSSSNFKKNLISSYSNSIEGMYVQEDKKLYYIMNDDDDKMKLYNPFSPNIVIIHELVHALQDQRGYLKEEDQSNLISDDISSARKAVIEGGATYVSYSIMSDYLHEKEKTYGKRISVEGNNKDIHLDYESVMLESSSLIYDNLKNSNGDELIYELTIFPYVSGGKFMKYAYDNGGWDEVNKVYTHMPVSTEQIIHPEKYFLFRDDPVTMPQRDYSFLLDKGGSLVTEGVFGEFGLYTYIGKFQNRLYARTASAGWGNDHYCLYSRGGHLLFVSESAWDSQQDGEEFLQTIKKVIEKRIYPLAWTNKGQLLVGHSGEQVVLLAKHGNEVLWVESSTRDNALLGKIVSQFGIPEENVRTAMGH